MLEKQPKVATYRPKQIRNTPATQDEGRATAFNTTTAAVSIPKPPTVGLNVKFKPEQSALVGARDIQQVGDKAKLHVRSCATLSERVTDGRPADGRRRFWNTVRKCGTAITAQTVNFDSTSSFAVLSGPVFVLACS